MTAKKSTRAKAKPQKRELPIMMPPRSIAFGLA